VNIFLTLDYELYFGSPTGTVDKCLIEPTKRLMEITRSTGACMTYFIDVGFILKLESCKDSFPELQTSYEKITEQIKALVAQGNDCQLHIHPHWEDSHFDGTKWDIDISRYKLSDFESAEILDIFTRYRLCLENLTGKPVTCYRAGGWCLQPFDKIKPAFSANSIKVDSTVYVGGYAKNETYYYDFTQTPNKSRWRFDSNLVDEDDGGSFLEIPISSMRYSPLFFWKLFGWGRMNPSDHKPIGDGKPVPGGGSKKDLLFSYNRLPVSLDGYFVTKLQAALRNTKGNDFVVIGHPKACTNFSLSGLEKFIRKNSKHTFKIMSSEVG